MKDSKIYYAISHLNSKERNRFKKYLESPYFNSDKNLVKLYSTLITKEKHIEKGIFDKFQLWKIVRPDTLFNDTRFRKYTSDLLKHIEGFLYQEYTRQDKGHEYPFILDALNERRMEKLYDSILRGGREAIEKNPRRDSRYYQRVYAIEKRFYEISDSDRKRGVAATTRDIADALDIFYIIEKLRIHCSVLVRSFYLEGNNSLRLIDEVIQLVEEQDLLKYKSIEIYYRLIKTYTDFENLDNYEKLEDLVKSSQDLFDPDEYVDNYTGLINYQARWINKGSKEALDKVINLYDYMLKNQVFNSQGELSPWSFRNGILAGLRTGKFEWVEWVLDNYSERLPSDYKKNALAFNYAQLHFYKKEFGEVLSYLQNVEYEDPAYALNSRNLLVAVYYELGQIDALYSTIHAFRTYLKRRKQLTERVRTGYRELLKITQRMAKLSRRDQEKVQKLHDYLEENKAIVSRQWLVSKVLELKEGKRKW